MKLNDFFRGSLRITFAIVTSVLLLFLIGWGGGRLLDLKEKADAKQYETIKPWEVDLQENLKVTLKVQTKLVNHQIFTKVYIEGYPPYLSDSRLQVKNRDAAFIITFQDKDGFKIHSKKIAINDFSKVVNAKGTPIGLRDEFQEFMSVDDYSRISNLSVQWSLDTVIPSAYVAPKSVDVKDSDPCATNLSKAERLKRLANLGALRETGNGSYQAGNHEAMFSTYDGSLIYCR